jgi:hypothetical protein
LASGVRLVRAHQTWVDANIWNLAQKVSKTIVHFDHLLSFL